MKKLIAILVGLSFMAIAAPVTAQSQTSDKPKTQFIKIEGMGIEGKRKGGDVFWEKHKDRAEFEPLHRLKKGFEPKIQESAKSAALQ